MRRLLLTLFACFIVLAPAGATVNTSANKTIALGTGIATSFSFSFVAVSCAYINVIYTDALGNQTTLTQGAGATQYQCSLSAVPQGGIWGIGGTITYNPSGTPIASGTTLTIYRILPYIQPYTLQNLGSIASLGKGAETGLDNDVMQGQQINEAIGRALQMNIANSAPPLPLPPAAQLANLGLCADSTGNNIIGCSLPASGVISSAMQPVVNSATLAAGRLAFGLGSMSQENINGGTCGGATIQDDGSAGGANGVGYARVVFATTADSTNQSVTCAFHGTERIATGPITYTLPRANTLFNGFRFRVTVASGLVTFAPNASDGFFTVASGTSVNVAAGATCTLKTNAASTGSWYLDCDTSPPTLSSGVGASALTLTLSASLINFRDATLNKGDPLWAIPAGGLSLTIPSGATLGASNGVPFKGWIFLAYNAATPIMGVATCSNTTSIFACSAWETIQKSGTAITSGSGTAGTLYTASAVTNDSVRIIGYFEYSAGLATAGTYNIAPTTVQLCIPPFTCKRPGDTIQTIFTQSAVQASTSSSTYSATNLTANITPTSAANLVKVMASGTMSVGTAGNTAAARFLRTAGTTLFGPTLLVGTNVTITLLETPCALVAIDAPGSTSSQTYSVAIASGNNSTTISWSQNSTNATMVIEEIMGALEPANDNLELLRMVG